MAHKTRPGRDANKRRREAARRKQEPLPAAEQARRAAANRAAKAREYPEPPAYGCDVHNPRPKQPTCYALRSL